MGRTDLEIRLNIDDRSLAPAELGLTEDEDIYLFFKIPDEGFHFSRHGSAREHLKAPNAGQEWPIERGLEDTTRKALQARFRYDPPPDTLVYLLNIEDVARFGNALMTADVEGGVLEVDFGAVMERFPFDEVHGVQGEHLATFLEEHSDVVFLGFDFGGEKAVASVPNDQIPTLGFPLDPLVLEDALEGTEVEERLTGPLLEGVGFALRSIGSDGDLVETVQSDAELVTDFLANIANEFQARLEQEVDVTYVPTEPAGRA